MFLHQNSHCQLDITHNHGILGVRKETIMSEKNSWESMKSDIGSGLEIAGFMLACYFLAPVIIVIGLYIFFGG